MGNVRLHVGTLSKPACPVLAMKEILASAHDQLLMLFHLM